jgi:hypothetical protein
VTSPRKWLSSFWPSVEDPLLLMVILDGTDRAPGMPGDVIESAFMKGPPTWAPAPVI